MDREIRPKKTQLTLAFSLWGITMLMAFYFLDVNFREVVDDSYSIMASADWTAVATWVDRAGLWGPIIIVVAMTVQMFLVVVPSVVLTAFSIIAYGPFRGIFLILFSVTIASSAGFFIGKFLGPATVERMIGKKKKDTVSFYVENYGFWVVFVTRLSPALSNDAISFVGGLLNMNYYKFIGATLSGTFILALLLSFSGGRDPRLETALVIVTLLSLLSLIVFMFFDRKKRRPS